MPGGVATVPIWDFKLVHTCWELSSGNKQMVDEEDERNQSDSVRLDRLIKFRLGFGLTWFICCLLFMELISS